MSKFVIIYNNINLQTIRHKNPYKMIILIGSLSHYRNNNGVDQKKQSIEKKDRVKSKLTFQIRIIDR